jgi:hypothetical protein
LINAVISLCGAVPEKLNAAEAIATSIPREAKSAWRERSEGKPEKLKN